MEVFTTLSFEAAHRFDDENPAYARVHGHSYLVEIRVRGPIDPAHGWVVDAAILNNACKEIHTELDHRFLNDVPGLSSPTTEAIAAWIWQRVISAVPQLMRVTVSVPSQGFGCAYEGSV